MFKRFLLAKVFLLSVLAGLFSCANRSVGPQGGPKDMAPPVFKEASPRIGQRNIHKKEIEVLFDEFVVLDKPQDKIIVSPPQIMPPTIRTNGRKIEITLNDSLLDNTTYSIDFTNSIKDLNEGNVLSNFSYSFSTGDELDTLQISGVVLNAENLNPQINYQVGIYADLNDTAFTNTKPLRIGRTDENGRFSIKNMKAGTYQVFALNDLNRDFMYNDPNEQMAFLDETLSPTAEIIQITDTTKKDSIPHIIQKTRFKPDSLLLLAFKEKVYKQSFIKAERKLPYKLSCYFNAPNITLPEFKALNFNFSNTDFIQSSAKRDTLNYWLNDSNTWKMDSLEFEIAYVMIDSLKRPFIARDTLNLKFHKPKENKKPDKQGKQGKQTKEIKNLNELNLTYNIKSLTEIYDSVRFQFEQPIASLSDTSIHLLCTKDTVWAEIPIKIIKLDSLGFQYGFTPVWDPELSYKLELDSAAFTSRYGLVSSKKSIPFRVKPLDQYATLIVNLLQYHPQAIIELLDNKDAVVRSMAAKEAGTEFEYLAPGDYYLRLFIDENNNGLWDAGNYAKKKQAEQVHYFNGKISLRANWDVEQEWDYKALSQQAEKPAVLIKKD